MAPEDLASMISREAPAASETQSRPSSCALSSVSCGPRAASIAVTAELSTVTLPRLLGATLRSAGYFVDGCGFVGKVF
jgi:hypothetical protein